jgi:hypothetical protein
MASPPRLIPRETLEKLLPKQSDEIDSSERGCPVSVTATDANKIRGQMLDLQQICSTAQISLHS